MTDKLTPEDILRRMIVINENTEWLDCIQGKDSTYINVDAMTWGEWLESTCVLEME